MGLFKSKYVRWLENLLEHVQMDMSNNYKDSAHETMDEFEKTLTEYKEAGILKDEELAEKDGRDRHPSILLMQADAETVAGRGVIVDVTPHAPDVEDVV